MIILQVTGEVPFEFEGQIVFEGSTEIHKSAERTRFHKIEIYKTKTVGWVLHIDYKTRWAGEHDFSEVWRRNSLAQIIRDICEYNPLGYVAGYPAGQHFAEKQRRLKIEIERDWEALKTLAFRALSSLSNL
jgi:hypothetical protein